MGLFHHKYKNPAKAAAPYLQKAGTTLQNTYNPYIERGENAYKMLEPQYNEMLDNPTDYYNEIYESYVPSSAYEKKADYLGKSLDNTMRSRGTFDTDEHDRRKASLINSLLSQDMQQFFNNIQGISSRGQQGYESLNNQGYSAANNLGSDLSNLYGSGATLAYNGAQDYNSRNGSKINSIAQLLSSALGAYHGYKNLSRTLTD